MKNSKAIYGAAFLMATSAIGPGFLTSTVLFTNKLMASFGFVILISIIIDVIVQSNIWQIIAIQKQPAQTIANNYLNGSGHVISLLIIGGGFVFNMGNIAGCGLGLQAIFGMQPLQAYLLSAGLAVLIFLFKKAGLAMDFFSKILGAMMILLMAVIAIKTNPPIYQALKESVMPSKFDVLAILTIVGGTVGGYISFSGAHRLLQQGISGVESLPLVKRSANTAIGIASTMRVLLFVAALGAISNGAIIDQNNPAASVFQFSNGALGLKLFGLVIWAASITSVVGASYTSVSFATSWHPFINKNQNAIVVAFIVLSAIVFALFGKPVKVLLFAGAINGLVLAIALFILLVAMYSKVKIKSYSRVWFFLGIVCASILFVAGVYSFLISYVF
jgi:Mn2+/Fe2+ NRAMP family transporter